MTVAAGAGAVGTSARPAGGGRSLEAITLEQRELINSDSVLSAGRVAAITAANRQRIGGGFGQVRQGLAVLLARSSATVDGFIARKRAEVAGMAAGVLASARGVVSGVMQAARAHATRAGESITSFVAGMSESLQGRVQGIARQIGGALGRISLPDIPGLAQLRAAASRLVGRAATAVAEGLAQVRNVISSAVRAATQIVNSLLGDVGRLVDGALKHVSDAVQRAVQAAFGALSWVAGMLQRALRAFVSAVVLPIVNRIEQRLVDALATGHRHAVDALRTNRDQHLQALAAPAGAGAGDVAATPEAAAGARETGQDAVQNNREIVATYQRRTSSTVGAIIQALAGGAANVARHVGSLVSRAIGVVVSKLHAIVQGLQRLIGVARAFAQSVLDAAASAFTEAVQFVRSLIEHPARQLIEFASGAWNRLTSFLGGFARRVLRGDFSIPGVADVIGQVSPPSAMSGQITTPRLGPITRPGVPDILLASAAVGAPAMALGPVLAGVIAALAVFVALGLSLAGLPIVAAVVTILVLILVFYLLYLLYKWVRSPTPSKPTIEHATYIKAPDGAPKTRTVVGVGERVVFTGNMAGAWKASTGTPTTGRGPSLSWTAPERATSATITLTVGSVSGSVSLTVLQPNAIAANKLAELTYPAGTQGAGMKLNFTYLPLSVSFGNVEAREVPGPASDIKGYYLKNGMPHWHAANTDFERIAENNTLRVADDTASQQGFPAPWDDGSFHWEIPNRFRVISELGHGEVFTTVKQEFIIKPTGKTKITKAGAEVERAP